MSSTPNEKESNLSLYTGGSSNASGGMYASVHGHLVKEVKVVQFVSNALPFQNLRLWLCSLHQSDQQHVIAGEVTMYDAI